MYVHLGCSVQNVLNTLGKTLQQKIVQYFHLFMFNNIIILLATFENNNEKITFVFLTFSLKRLTQIKIWRKERSKDYVNLRIHDRKANKKTKRNGKPYSILFYIYHHIFFRWGLVAGVQKFVSCSLNHLRFSCSHSCTWILKVYPSHNFQFCLAFNSEKLPIAKFFLWRDWQKVTGEIEWKGIPMYDVGYIVFILDIVNSSGLVNNC